MTMTSHHGSGRDRARRQPARTEYPRRRKDQTQPKQSGGGQNSTAKGVGAKISAVLDAPQLNYKVILSITLMLTAIGLTMVLSSSMVTARTPDTSVWSVFLNQALYVVLGLVVAWLALRLRADTIKAISPWLLGLALFLQVALFIPGVGVGAEIGSHSWIRFGSFGIQPSELSKVALAVWGAAEISSKTRQTDEFRPVLGRFLAVGTAMVLLVLLQKDLGMMLTVGIVLMALFFFSGVSARLIALVGGVIALLATGATVAQAYRSDRITTWKDTLFLNFREGSTSGPSYQSYQGLLSLSDGSLTGTGLGQSRAKWYYLPEAKNDFIFAIIGEELGWVGAIIVVALFAFLGWFGIRTALAQADPFLSMLAATLTLGIVVQALYNISYVVGLMPMTGIQLPLISAGGTSMVITLGSLGLLANCARHEPKAISSMQHEGRSLFDRMFLLPEPLPYRAGEERRIERRNTTQRYGRPVTRRESTAGTAGQDVRRERDRNRRAQERLPHRDRVPDYDGTNSWHRQEPLPQRRSRSSANRYSPRRK